jgi:hypothetical protein
MPLFIVFGVLALAGVLFASWYFSRDVRARRKLARTPMQAIVDVVPGTISRLTGMIQPLAEQLTAPMSGRRCAYYLVIVEVYRSSGKSGHWHELLREEQSVDFLLRDNTGIARIQMDGPHVAVVRDHKTRSGTFDDPTPVEAAFLERLGEQATNFLGLNRTLRYTEGALEFGEDITVLGAARPGADQVDLVLETPPQGPMLLTDHPGTVKAVPRALN